MNLKDNTFLKKIGNGGAAAVATTVVLAVGVTAAGAVGVANVTGIIDDNPTPTSTTVLAGGATGSTDDNGGATGGNGADDSAAGTGSTSSTVPGDSSTSSTVPGETTTTVPVPTKDIPVDGVGIVTITDTANPEVVSVTPVEGFTPKVEVENGEVHVKFFDAAGNRIDVQAEWEDGQLRVRVRDRRLENGRRNGSNSPSVTAPAAGGAPAPTAPRADDSRGRGRGSDDGRGRGRGSDDAPRTTAPRATTPRPTAPRVDDSRGRGRGSDDSGSDDSRGRGRGSDDSGSGDSTDD